LVCQRLVLMRVTYPCTLLKDQIIFTHAIPTTRWALRTLPGSPTTFFPLHTTEPIIRSRIQAGTADSGKQQQHDLSPHKYSFCQTRPLKTIILEMSPNSRFDNAWHCDRSMRSKPSFSISSKTPDVQLQSRTRINSPGSDYLRPAR
jgi:hypothetical protein